MIHSGSNTCLLLQLRITIRFGTEILVQQFERDEPLQLRVARLIHCAHSTGTKRLHRHKMIESPLQQIFLTAVPADHPHQRCITAGLERGKEDGRMFYDKWMADRAFLLVPAQAIVGAFLKTFAEFPPRQKPASFSIDQALEKARQQQDAMTNAAVGAKPAKKPEPAMAK